MVQTWLQEKQEKREKQGLEEAEAARVPRGRRLAGMWLLEASTAVGAGDHQLG